MKLLVVALSLFIGNAFACSCSEWGTPREMLSDAKVAFVGMVASARAAEMSPDSGELLTLTNFRVTQSFKPRGLRKAQTRSEVGDGGNCGTQFQVGQSYLVFGYAHEGKVYTDDCSIQLITGERSQNVYLRGLERASRSGF